MTPLLWNPEPPEDEGRGEYYFVVLCLTMWLVVVLAMIARNM